MNWKYAFFIVFAMAFVLGTYSAVLVAADNSPPPGENCNDPEGNAKKKFDNTTGTCEDKYDSCVDYCETGTSCPWNVAERTECTAACIALYLSCVF